jgi:hypothetical protein
MAPIAEAFRLAQRAEQAAWTDFVRGAPAAFAAELGIASAPIADGFVMCCAEIPAPILNRAFAFGLDGPIVEADLDRALGFFSSRGADGVAVQVAPATRPEEVTSWLRARGFSPRDRRVQMIRDVRPPPRTTTSLRAGLVPVEEAEAFARVCITCFEMPESSWPGVAALVGRPDWHEVRGRGGQSTLMRMRIDAARELGCRHVVTQTHDDLPDHPNPSLRNMRRAGFEEVLWETLWQR